jgi:hypothetical protein
VPTTEIPPTPALTRGYTATKDALLTRLRRIDDQVDKTDELMAAVARLMRRG